MLFVVKSIAFSPPPFPAASPPALKDTKKESHHSVTLSQNSAPTYSPTGKGSTIGVKGLNFSVRDGKRWIPFAIDTF